MLKWRTQQEENVAYFVIEHAVDSQAFSAIGIVNAIDNSNIPNDYLFTHAAPNLNSNYYYRLRQVDTDDHGTYSFVRTVRFSNGSAEVHISPNPVQNLLRLNVQEPNMRMEIIRPDGGRLCRQLLQPGLQEINMSRWPAGIYEISIYQRQRLIITKHIIKL